MEPAETVQTGFDCANELLELCGFTMGKLATPSLKLRLLGAEISIRKDFPPAALPSEKRDALIGDIREILKSG